MIARLFLVLALGVLGCGDDSPSGDFGTPLDEDGKNSLLQTGYQDAADKSDASVGRPGLPASVGADSAVWEVKNQWFDTDTAAAREAGLAWGEDSGLSWEQKFNAWVDSLPKVARSGSYSYGQTYQLTTPWGTTVDAPALECAESAMFLRITFASWYQLPFVMEAIDGNRKRVFFGHFGIRTEDGIYPGMPAFKTRYADKSSEADAVRNGAQWPTDTTLAARKLAGGRDDLQPMIGPEAHAGAYFDKIFLNKRVGYFLLIQLAYTGSANLADPANTYNITPESIEPGDFLVERWQRTGIGHVLIVMDVKRVGEQELDGETVPVLEAELASGSMPRRQPVWEDSDSSMSYFTLEETGGGEYVEFGGGVKRWRTPVVKGGRWNAVVLDDDYEDFIPTTQKERLAARPERFESILKRLTTEEKLAALVKVIDSKRAHLRSYPASCSARINREKAFDDLYAITDEAGMSRDEVDRKYRLLEDYVFAELEYESSKTCCWNSSTANMYDIVMQYNEARQNDPDALECPAIESVQVDQRWGRRLRRIPAVCRDTRPRR
ncbi:MAG: hypothetical protein R3E66_21945 [bacterium]